VRAESGRVDVGLLEARGDLGVGAEALVEVVSCLRVGHALQLGEALVLRPTEVLGRRADRAFQRAVLLGEGYALTTG
jgi:hypothetical protein